MADDYLLVPMHLDAMVLNKMAGVTTPFLRFQMDYSKLSDFESPEPAPFAGGSSAQPASGIYLHWTLPKALRHGIHKDDGGTEFPVVPNRWLVVRVQAGAPNNAIKAWVLESDYLSPPDGSAEGTSPYVDPRTVGQDGLPQATAIGRALLLKDFVESPTPATPFLKAVAPTSAIFTVFSPGVENVFSLYDDVSDDAKTAIAKGEFSYHVTGWYSDPSHDPINDPNLEWVLNDGQYNLQWNESTPSSVTQHAFDWHVLASAANLPKKMLTHALLSGICWDRDSDNVPAENYPADVQNKVRVAIGNTAIDALAGIVRLDQNNQTEADLWEAFQYDLLEMFDQPGSAEAVNIGIREHWFTASSGGTRWTAVAREQAPTQTGSSPEVTGDQLKAVAALNSTQAEYDRQLRILQSMQWNLFSLWWKNQWLNAHQQATNYVPPPIYDPQGSVVTWLVNQLGAHTATSTACQNLAGTDPSQESWYICKVKAQQNLVAQLFSQKKVAHDALEAQLGLNRLVLKAVNTEPYYSANDPVILISGLGRSTNFDPIDGLMCRLPSQTVSTLTVNGQAYGFDSSAQHNILNQIPALANADKVPDAIQELHQEALLLSPRLFAGDILGNTVPCPVPAGTADPQTDAVRQAYKSLPQPAAGARFAPVSFAMEEWQQPWVPLVLDWQVTVIRDPAYTSPKDPQDTNLQLECEFNQELWQFDGTDYNWTGPTDAGPVANFDPQNPVYKFDSNGSQMVLTGRTFVTPQLSFLMADQLEDYVKKHKLRDPALEKLLETLESYLPVFRNQDILSQRLSGMRAMMVERSYRGHAAPYGDITSVLGDLDQGHPLPFPNIHYGQDSAVWDFAPMAGTFFVVNKLTVIDSFGRTVDLMLANFSANPQVEKDPNAPDSYFYPIAGRDLRAATAKDPAPGIGPANNATQRMLKLTPRLAQDSQLSLRLLSNDGNDQDIYEQADTNPICGWIVPNHLDRSLALYGPDGTAWGELFLSLHAEKKFVPVWQPDPTNASAPQTVADIPNSFARDMIKALWNRADDGLGFYDFLQVIDETLWTINPRGQRQDENLSVLIGRPLAIVRAQLSLKLKGLPFYNQDWWDTFQVDFGSLPDDGTAHHDVGVFDGGVKDHVWPVRLGSQVLRNDGFIGYFADDPNTADNTFKVFNTVHLPAEIQTDYLKQIDQNNYLKLKFIDDSVAAPDPKQNQVCKLTMLVDPRGTIHAFSGLLPVITVDVPSEFVGAALEKMSYMFRAGPFLTSPDQLRIPQPAESKGQWTWFDLVAKAAVDVTKADDQVRLSTTTPLVKEGWLKFTPDTSND